MRIPMMLFGVVALAGVPAVAAAQDAVATDAAHYTVISENDQVRILKIHYGPHEKSVMHSHPDAVVVFLTDGKMKFTMPDGKTEMHEMKKGEAQFTPKTVHLPENESAQPMEAVLVEMKGAKE